MVNSNNQERSPFFAKCRHVLVGRYGGMRCAAAWLTPIGLLVFSVAVFPVLPLLAIAVVVYAVALFRVGGQTLRDRIFMTVAVVLFAISVVAAQYLWMVGFNAADGGSPVPAIARFEPVFLVVAMASVAAFVCPGVLGHKNTQSRKVSC